MFIKEFFIFVKGGHRGTGMEGVHCGTGVQGAYHGLGLEGARRGMGVEGTHPAAQAWRVHAAAWGVEGAHSSTGVEGAHTATQGWRLEDSLLELVFFHYGSPRDSTQVIRLMASTFTC